MRFIQLLDALKTLNCIIYAFFQICFLNYAEMHSQILLHNKVTVVKIKELNTFNGQGRNPSIIMQIMHKKEIQHH